MPLGNKGNETSLNPTQIILKEHLSEDVEKIALAFIDSGKITKEKDYIAVYGMLMTCLEWLFIEGKIILKKQEGANDKVIHE